MISDVVYRLRTIPPLYRIRKALGNPIGLWWWKMAARWAITGKLVKPEGCRMLGIDICSTCHSDKKELRKLVQLPGDEHCPNCQWDKCTDDWHKTQEEVDAEFQ